MAVAVSIAVCIGARATVVALPLRKVLAVHITGAGSLSIRQNELIRSLQGTAYSVSSTYGKPQGSRTSSRRCWTPGEGSLDIGSDILHHEPSHSTNQTLASTPRLLLGLRVIPREVTIAC